MRLSPIQPSSALKKFTTFDYAQDGLIFCLDAIENAGRLVHDSSASTVWTDVISNEQYVTYKSQQEHVEIHSNFYKLTTSGGFRGNLGELANAVNAGKFTVEAVCRYEWIVTGNTDQRIYIANRDGNDPGFDMVRYGRPTYDPQQYNDSLYIYNVSFGSPVKALPVPGQQLSYCAYAIDAIAKTASGYHDGAYINSCSFNPQSATYRTQAKQIWFGTSQNQTPFQTTGKACALRAYNRLLSAEEIRHNYLIDKVRFGVR